MFKGSYTALITPFKGGKIDRKALEALITWQVAQGTHGLVPCGTTGESPTLNHREHNEVIEICIKTVGGKAKVIAGTGSNSTAEAIMMTQHAEKVGADAVLVMTPYYNKPTQKGLFQHFRAIHDSSGIPIILYNIPGRSVVDIKDETLKRLIELPRIAGIKDATSDLNRPVTLSEILKGRKDEFSQLSGEDATAVEFNERGGVGCISVTANIAPKLCAKLQEACLSGDFTAATTLQGKLMPIHNAMFVETNPQPVKFAAFLMGLCTDEIRLPLVMPDEENKAKIKAALESAGLL